MRRAVCNKEKGLGLKKSEKSSQVAADRNMMVMMKWLCVVIHLRKVGSGLCFSFVMVKLGTS